MRLLLCSAVGFILMSSPLVRATTISADIHIHCQSEPNYKDCVFHTALDRYRLSKKLIFAEQHHLVEKAIGLIYKYRHFKRDPNDFFVISASSCFESREINEQLQDIHKTLASLHESLNRYNQRFKNQLDWFQLHAASVGHEKAKLLSTQADRAVLANYEKRANEILVNINQISKTRIHDVCVGRGKAMVGVVPSPEMICQNQKVKANCIYNAAALNYNYRVDQEHKRIQRRLNTVLNVEEQFSEFKKRHDVKDFEIHASTCEMSKLLKRQLRYWRQDIVNSQNHIREHINNIEKQVFTLNKLAIQHKMHDKSMLLLQKASDYIEHVRDKLQHVEKVKTHLAQFRVTDQCKR